MARPINLNLLLSSVGNSTATKGKVEKPSSSQLLKPKFLSKVERNIEKLNSDKVIINESNELDDILPALQINKLSRKAGIENKHIDTVNSEQTAPLSHQSVSDTKVKRSKFQFNWDHSDDTLSNFEPITRTSAATLLKQQYPEEAYAHNNVNKVEKSYMGKHWTEKVINEMTDRDWRILKEDFDITTKGGSVQQPMRNWEELFIIPNDLLDIIVDKLGFKKPTPIQRITIPNVIQQKKQSNGRDFMGIASTGSGKTLAFVIPILIKLSKMNPRPTAIKTMEGPKALILAPTRELAQQIQAQIQAFTELWTGRGQNYNAISIVGGHSMEEISFDLSKGCDILTATPGRLIDCLENHLLVLNQVETLVLDEADKMIDLGFEDQLTSILAYLDTNSSVNKRQTLMFTATMSPAIERVANGYLRKPAYATIGTSEEFVPKIQQIVEYIETDEQKFKRLRGLLGRYNPPIIVFINYKITGDWLAQKFQQETSLKVTILHGSKSQEQREHSLQLLRTGKAQVMIATNVAARGIDIPNVSLVVNFQMATKFEDYVHRIGRTGRAGNTGTAVTFLGDKEEVNVVEDLYKYVKDHSIANDPVHSNVFADAAKKKYELSKYDDSKDHILY